MYALQTHWPAGTASSNSFSVPRVSPYLGSITVVRNTGCIKGALVRELKGRRECNGQHDVVVTVDIRMVWVKGRLIATLLSVLASMSIYYSME